MNYPWAEPVLEAFDKDISQIQRYQVLQWNLKIKRLDELNKLQMVSDVSIEISREYSETEDHPIYE